MDSLMIYHAAICQEAWRQRDAAAALHTQQELSAYDRSSHRSSSFFIVPEVRRSRRADDGERSKIAE